MPPTLRTKPYILANLMVAGFFASMFFGVILVLVISESIILRVDNTLMDATVNYGFYFDLPVCLLQLWLILRYERPIRLALRRIGKGQNPDTATLQWAQRRLLNEPYILMAIDLGSWIVAAVYYYALIQHFGSNSEVAIIVALYSVLTGLIAAVVTFVVSQYCLQRYLVPVFFPRGKLSSVPRTRRVTIATRLAAWLLSVCIIPFAIIGISLLEVQLSLKSGLSTRQGLSMLTELVTLELVLFSVSAVLITVIMTANLTHPFEGIIVVLKKIKRGQLGERVDVVSNDEIGYTGDAINAMAQGLQERETILRELLVAREIQQNLLPRRAPVIQGLDMAGSCLFCDATGGDYFDYIPLTRDRKQLLAVVVADVSGHGVSAALTMAGIRAQLHSRISLPGSADDILAHLNGQLSADTEETGQFITLFYLEIDPLTLDLSWIRAGHDPAFLYDPGTDSFEALAGTGLPLGVDADCAYPLQQTRAREGQVLLLVTDGIAETRNMAGEMYGRERFQAAVRRGIARDAESIRDTVLEDLDSFRGTAPQEDDVTMVVVKFETADGTKPLSLPAEA